MPIHVGAVMNKIYTKAIFYDQAVCFSNRQSHVEGKHPNLMAVCLYLPQLASSLGSIWVAKSMKATLMLPQHKSRLPSSKDIQIQGNIAYATPFPTQLYHLVADPVWSSRKSNALGARKTWIMPLPTPLPIRIILRNLTSPKLSFLVGKMRNPQFMVCSVC